MKGLSSQAVFCAGLLLGLSTLSASVLGKAMRTLPRRRSLQSGTESGGGRAGEADHRGELHEDLSEVPRTHPGWLTSAHNSSRRDFDASGLCGQLYVCIHASTHTHTQN